ncbi:MAG: hypothetical protein HY722_12560 [Planctomycetes bacterium]|nr:hypothetical protein [Planctomycetota bacterium]
MASAFEDLLARLAVECSVVGEEAMARCLTIQRLVAPDDALEDILHREGYLTAEQRAHVVDLRTRAQREAHDTEGPARPAGAPGDAPGRARADEALEAAVRRDVARTLRQFRFPVEPPRVSLLLDRLLVHLVRSGARASDWAVSGRGLLRLVPALLETLREPEGVDPDEVLRLLGRVPGAPRPGPELPEDAVARWGEWWKAHADSVQREVMAREAEEDEGRIPYVLLGERGSGP